MTKYNRVVILGAAGFIGYHLAKSLAVEAKVDLLLVDNFIRGANDEDFLKLSGLQNVNFAELDLSKESSFENLFNKSDLVINCAALNGTQNFYQVPLDVMLNTGISAFFAARYAALAQVHKYIYLGSSESYAGGVNLGFVGVPTSESVPLVIENVENIRWSYSLGKTFGEIACYSANSQLGLNFQILRIHNIYGPRMGNKHVIPDLIEKFRLGNMDVPGHGESRAFMYIDDLVGVVRFLISNENNDIKLMNVGSQTETLIKILAEKIAKVLEIEKAIKPLESWPGSVKRRLPDTSLLRSIYAFDETSLDEGLDKTISWYLNH
jgi:nucleoside-diphosphate-sugar epimerase